MRHSLPNTLQVLGDEEMEALSTGPLRNLSITSHHMHSFSNTGSPSAALRTPSALTAPGSRNQSFAASTAHTADLQKALQSLSMRDNQQQQQRHSAGGAGPSSGAESSAGGGGAAAAAAAGLAAGAGSSAAGGSSAASSTATTLQGQQQGQLLLPSEHGSSGAASCQEQRQQQLHSTAAAAGAAGAAAAAGADDDAIESIMEEVLHEVCSTAMPGSIELGDSPTHNTILTRRLAYEGAGPSRLNNPGSTGPSAGAAEQASSTAQQEAAATTAEAAAAAVTGRVSAAGDQKQQQQQQQQGNEAPKATAADAAVVRAFMEMHCSQLTPFGLSCMSDVLKEHQLAVFFRNNHFNTLFKYEGAVYLLVTDQGYEYEPDIVWERLDSVQGDTTFCTSEFTPFVPHRAPEAAADGAATYTQVVAGGSAAAAAGGNIAALTDLDAAIAASLAVGDQHSHPGDAVTGSQDHADADYALALQLQLQEEEAAAAARAQQQQQGQQQQQQPPPQQQQQYNRQGSRVSAVQQQEQQQQVQPLESLRQMGQRLASGLQQQYANATGAAMEQQQQQPPSGRQQQGRRGSHSGGGRRPAQDEKCSIM